MADLIVAGSNVITLDPARPNCDAIAIRDNSIVALGQDDVFALRGPATEVVDGSGWTLTPGLVDGHVHPFYGTDLTRGIDLGNARSLEDVRLALVEGRVNGMLTGDWLLGYGLSYDLFVVLATEFTHFDDVVGETPAVLTFFDDHASIANSEALRAAGVSGPRDFGSASKIVCDEAGRPTGLLLERDAMRLVKQAVPELSRAERLLGYRNTMIAMNKVGLTGAHLMDGELGLLDDLKQLEGEDQLSLRLRAAVWREPSVTDDEIDELADRRGSSGRLWAFETVKLFVDGVVESGTAWLREPDTSGHNCVCLWPNLDRYYAVVKRLVNAGFQVASHAVGDAAVRAALDAYRLAGRATVGQHRIEHIEAVHDDDVPRFAEQGVTASMQAAHMPRLNDSEASKAWRTELTAQQQSRGFRIGDLSRAGATVALGSDWTVASYDPRDGMAWSRSRRPPGVKDAPGFRPDQAIDGLTALRGYSEGLAVTSGDRRTGRITIGSRADITGFAADPVACDADDVVDIPITLTVVDGRVVHR